ncbi:hypothetical protein AB0H76_07015 [Nocardia sp. NPDC050712]|uniref:Rv1733c family protein n=1 Tax=Nocardia sp. NPDC050712 TaxID=3155518 RepID=UPI0033E6AF9F
MPKQPRVMVRMWRLRPWSTNPLMRASDRCEVLVRLLAALAVLAAVPLAGAAGTAAYSAAATRLGAENATKVAVTAVIVQPPQQVAARLNQSGASLDVFTAPVRWTWQDRSGTATIGVPGSGVPGDEVRIWLGPDGNPADAPLPTSAAASEGIAAGLMVLCVTWAGALALVCLTTWSVGARRAAHWAREWRAIDHRIGGEDRR